MVSAKRSQTTFTHATRYAGWGYRASKSEAARRIVALGPSTVIVKGGHLPTDQISDLLYDGHRWQVFTAERVAGRHTHGTGCTFSAVLVAHLALGRPLAEAIPLAQQYVAGAIRRAPGLGQGHGTMNHFWEGGTG